MYALRNQIYVGSLENPTYYFENDQISLCPSSQAVALVGQELSIDIIAPVVADNEDNLLDVYHFRSSDGQEIQTGVGQVYAIDKNASSAGSNLINLEDGTPVWYYHEGELVGKFYVETVTRQARNRYKLSCTSAIGRLQKKYHGGGLFQNTTFGDVLQHILADGLHGTGDPVISYTIEEEVANLPVSGWLPYSTKRDNLYRMILAYGVNIVKNWDGTPRFAFIFGLPEVIEEDAEIDVVQPSRIKNGGSVEYEKPYSKVTVMEHTYTPITEADPVTLFDNSIGTAVSNEEIWFDNAPIIVSTLTVEGSLTIVSATENSAVISGNGVLTGIPYTQSTRSVSRSNPGASEEKTLSVEDCTMVNLINSENLLNRLYSFYCPSNFIKSIKNSIKFTDERCGKAYRLKNPYGEDETAFLASMDITASSFNQADCVWYANYTPAGQEGLYDHVIILNKETFEEDGGTFTVPDGVDDIKVVIIGGGTGGGSGWPGENGEDATTHVEVESTADLSAVWYGAEGGDGGLGGSGGTPGRVKIIKIENPDASYNYTIGDGGEGGAATGFIPDTVNELRAAMENEQPDYEYTDSELQNLISTYENTGWSGSPNPGSAGTASTFGSYSSDDSDGEVPTGGVYEQIYNNFYALPGKGGIRGGKGGARKVSANGTFNWVTDGEDVVGDNGTVWKGGSTGRMLTDVEGLSEARGKLKAYGGNGAGAAVGIGRGFIDPETEEPFDTHINGGSDQWTYWDVVVDSEWIPPTPTPSPSPVPPPEPPPGAPALSATLVADKDSVRIGETITWTMTASGGNGEYSYFFTVYRDGSIVESPGVWQQSPSCTWTVEDYGKYSVAGYVTDSRDIEIVQASQGGQVEAPYIEPLPPYTTEGLYAKIGDRRSGSISQLSAGVYGPMGEGTGVGPITPVKSNGEEITINTAQDYEINLVFKFTVAFPQTTDFKSPDVYSYDEMTKDCAPRMFPVIDPNRYQGYFGQVEFNAAIVWPDPRDPSISHLTTWELRVLTLELNEWYQMNFKKVGQDHWFVATDPEGNQYSDKYQSQPYTLTHTLDGLFVPSFGSDESGRDSCNGVCYDLSRCYIKQSGRRIWGVPE